MSYDSDTVGGAAEGVGGGASSGGYDSDASGSHPTSTGGGNNAGMSLSEQYASYGEGRAAAEASVRESSGDNGYSASATLFDPAQYASYGEGRAAAEASVQASSGDSSAPAKGTTTTPGITLKNADTAFKTVMAIAGLFAGPIGLIAGVLSLANMQQSGAYGKLGTSPPSNPNTGPTAASIAGPSASGFPGAGYGVGDHTSSYSAPIIGWAGAPVKAPAAQAAPAIAALPIHAARLAPATRTAAPTTTNSTGSTNGGGAIGALVLGGAVLALLA